MRASLSRWSLVSAMLGALLCGASGCKSGVSSPADWLSWGKKPSPTALSGNGPKKPSATGLPSPHAATNAQSSLASNSYPDYGNQGYPAATAGNTSQNYDTGPYGMASHSTPGYTNSDASPYAHAGVASGNQYTSNSTPYSGTTSPYAGSASTQPGAYPGADSEYRTADTRSASQPESYERSAGAFGGQTAYGQDQSSYGQPGVQNTSSVAAGTYPTTAAADTTGLSNSAGPFQPGSTRSSGSFPTSGNAANYPGSAPQDYSGTTAPTGYPSSGATGSGSYPATNSQLSPGGNYPATGSSAYPATGAGAYPATSGAGQGYTSPYPNSGY